MIVYALRPPSSSCMRWQTNEPWRPKHHRRHLPCPNQPLVHCNNMASNVRRSKRSRLSPPLPQSHEELQIICAGCSLDLCNSAYASIQCDHNMSFECFGALLRPIVPPTSGSNVLIVLPMTIAPVKQIRGIFTHQP